MKNDSKRMIWMHKNSEGYNFNKWKCSFTVALNIADKRKLNYWR